jgi:hypothetical protein
MAQVRAGTTVDELYRVEGKADAEPALPGWSMSVDESSRAIPGSEGASSRA